MHAFCMTASIARTPTPQIRTGGLNSRRAGLGRLFRMIPGRPRTVSERMKELASFDLQLRNQVGAAGTLVSRSERVVPDALLDWTSEYNPIKNWVFRLDLRDAKAHFQLGKNTDPVTLANLIHLQNSADIFANLGFERSRKRVEGVFIQQAIYYLTGQLIKPATNEAIDQAYYDVVDIYMTMPYSVRLFKGLAEFTETYAGILEENHRNSEAANVYVVAAQRMRHAKNRAQAIAYYKKAIVIYKSELRSNLSVEQERSILENLKMVYSELLYQYEALKGENPQAFDQSKHADLLVESTLCLIQLGDYDEALDSIDSSLKVLWAIKGRILWAELMFKKVLVLEELGQTELACDVCSDLLDYLKRFIQEYPDTRSAYQRVFDLAVKKQKTFAELIQAQQIEAVNLFVTYAKEMMSREEFQDALESIEDALPLLFKIPHPSEYMSLAFCRILIYEKQEEYALALKACEDLIEVVHQFNRRDPKNQTVYERFLDQVEQKRNHIRSLHMAQVAANLK